MEEVVIFETNCLVFSKNATRKRFENALQDFSIRNKIALNLLKNEKPSKLEVKSRRLNTVRDNINLIKTLNLMKV